MKLRGDILPAAVFVPTLSTEASATQYIDWPVRLSNQSLAMMPCMAGGAPLKKLAWPGPVIVGQ